MALFEFLILLKGFIPARKHINMLNNVVLWYFGNNMMLLSQFVNKNCFIHLISFETHRVSLLSM